MWGVFKKEKLEKAVMDTFPKKFEKFRKNFIQKSG